MALSVQFKFIWVVEITEPVKLVGAVGTTVTVPLLFEEQLKITKEIENRRITCFMINYFKNKYRENSPYDKFSLNILFVWLKKQKKRYYRDDDFLTKVGVRIREIRTSQGLTQTDLAFKCNDKDYSQINRVELGKVNFSVSYLSLIASALNVEPKDLLGPLNPHKEK